MGNNERIIDMANIIDKENIVIYLGKNIDSSSIVTNAVMLVTHEFTRTGAPIVLLEMGKILASKGVSVWALCEKEDSLMEDYIAAGINVVIYSKYASDDKWLYQCRHIFDFWCVNTLTLLGFFDKLNNSTENVIWWLHEDETFFEHYEALLEKIELSISSKIVAAGPYVKSMIKKYMNLDADILNFSIEDAGISVKQHKTNDKVKFLQIGTINEKKGQDITVDAINLLDEETLKKAEFVFCGNRKNANENELKKIDELVKINNNVKRIDEVDRETLYKMYDELDAVVVASKIEPTSAVMVESMMKGILGICSDVCGVTYYLEDNKSGFIFKSEDAQDLANRIKHIIDNVTELDEVRKNARKVYEEVYAEPVFEKNMENLLRWAESNQKLMKRNPMVSIVAVTSNNGLGLLNSLNSIYNQTYKNIEIVIVDDCSTDGTLEIIEQRFGDKTNIKYFINDSVMGKGASYNLALENCSGEYISFIEPGDEWLKDKLERQMDVLIPNENIDGIYSFAQVIDKRGKSVLYPFISADEPACVKNNISLLMMKSHNYVNIGTIIFRTEVFTRISGFNTDLNENAAYEFLFRELGKLRFYRIPDIMMVTRNAPINKNSIEDYIKANYYILVGEAEYINGYPFKEVFFNDIYEDMKSLGVEDVFMELLEQENGYAKLVEVKKKKFSDNQCVIKNVSEVENCVGCGNCNNICPVQAIRFEYDEYGFKTPVVDNDKCIECGKCTLVCPLCNKVKGIQFPNECLAVQTEDTYRMKASSGGVFPAIAMDFVEKGGYVCGVVFDDDFIAKHIVTNNIAEVENMFESKYMQSDLNDCFIKIQRLLEAGKKVLFSGTPCQNASLYQYLNKDYDNLFKVGIVCHGVPSPKIFKEYIKEKAKKEIKEVSFRRKEKLGWQSGLYIEFEDSTELINESSEDLYMNLFLENVILRESCYDCKFKDLLYCDILLGDFWGIGNIKKIDDEKGTSYISVASEKGRRLIAGIDKSVTLCESIKNNKCIKYNSAINYSVERKVVVDNFWNNYIGSSKLGNALDRMCEMKHFDIALALMWSRNYGNALTNYGLYKALEKLGKSVVVLDNMGTLFPNGKFEIFAQKHYNCSSSYTIKGDYARVVKLSETFMVGSDQTWNYQCELNHGFGSYYQLSFVPDEKKLLAYGPSFGSSIDYKEANQVKHLYERFDAIGVREQYGVDILSREYGVKSKLVADPVFLLGKEDYEKLASESNLSIDKPFVVSYILNPNKKKIQLVNDIAKKLGAEVINIIDSDENCKEKNIIAYEYKNYLYEIAIEDFLYYFANSEFVITDSFHGTCFALILNKKFAAIKNRQSERFNIFSKFGNASERVFESVGECDVCKMTADINFIDINKDIEKLREASLNWLSNNI